MIQFGLLIYKTFDSEGEVHVIFAKIKVEFAGDAALFDKWRDLRIVMRNQMNELRGCVQGQDDVDKEAHEATGNWRDRLASINVKHR